MPVMGEREVFDVDVEEISGICLNADRTALLAIGDQGVVKQISFDGEVTDVMSYYADMEGVTLDPNTGDMYIASEWDQSVLKLDESLHLIIHYAAYNQLVDLPHSTVAYIVSIYRRLEKYAAPRPFRAAQGAIVFTLNTHL